MAQPAMAGQAGRSVRGSIRLAAVLAAMALASPGWAADGPQTARARAAYETAVRAGGEQSAAALGAEVALANALLAEDHLAEGVQRLEHFRDTMIAVAGPDAPEALMVSATLAMAMVNGGQAARGEALARDVTERAARTRGESDIVTVLARASLGGALSLQGRYAEAYPLLQAGYQGMGAAFGPGALETRQFGALLQTVSAGLGYDAEALALRRALAEPPPAGSPEALVLFAQGQQVALLDAEGRYAEALEVGEPLAERLEALRGPRHTATLDVLATLASAHRGLGQTPAAVALMRRVVDGYRQARGADDPTTLRLQETLGLYLTGGATAAERQEGRALMARTIEQRRATMGEHIAQVTLAQIALGMSYINDPDAEAHPTEAMRQSFAWLEEADRNIAADPAQRDSPMGMALNTLIGTQLINQRDYAGAYGRLARGAAVLRARAGDRRAASTGEEATALLTGSRVVLLTQVRAGWLWAHQP